MKHFEPLSERDFRLMYADCCRRLEAIPSITSKEGRGMYLRRIEDRKYQILGQIWLIKDECKARGIELDV